MAVQLTRSKSLPSSFFFVDFSPKRFALFTNSTQLECRIVDIPEEGGGDNGEGGNDDQTGTGEGEGEGEGGGGGSGSGSGSGSSDGGGGGSGSGSGSGSDRDESGGGSGDGDGGGGSCSPEEEAMCADISEAQKEALSNYDNGGKVIVCDPTCEAAGGNPMHCNCESSAVYMP